MHRGPDLLLRLESPGRKPDSRPHDRAIHSDHGLGVHARLHLLQHLRLPLEAVEVQNMAGDLLLPTGRHRADHKARPIHLLDSIEQNADRQAEAASSKCHTCNLVRLYTHSQDVQENRPVPDILRLLKDRPWIRAACIHVQASDRDQI